MVKAKTYGRMGNFLFQVATTIGYAATHKIAFSVPNTTNDPKNNPIYLQHLVNPNWDKSRPEVLVEEHGHQYQEIPFDERWRDRNIILNGYWQSEQYFLEFRELIIKLFGYPYEAKWGVVSVHVRRGDYIHLTQKHPPVTKEWYEGCMSQFPNAKFKFFSDDIMWCHQEFGNRADCAFSSNTTEEQDLIEISQCEHHISSASTFSWWGAWLNQNPRKRVLIPQRWFTEREELRNNTGDIVPATWERV